MSDSWMVSTLVTEKMPHSERYRARSRGSDSHTLLQSTPSGRHRSSVHSVHLLPRAARLCFWDYQDLPAANDGVQIGSAKVEARQMESPTSQSCCEQQASVVYDVQDAGTTGEGHLHENASGEIGVKEKVRLNTEYGSNEVGRFLCVLEKGRLEKLRGCRSARLSLSVPGKSRKHQKRCKPE
jgi:hypothetical protein